MGMIFIPGVILPIPLFIITLITLFIARIKNKKLTIKKIFFWAFTIAVTPFSATCFFLALALMLEDSYFAEGTEWPFLLIGLACYIPSLLFVPFIRMDNAKRRKLLLQETDSSEN